MRVALSEMVVDGIKTNIPLQQRILRRRRLPAGRAEHPLPGKAAGGAEREVAVDRVTQGTAARCRTMPASRLRREAQARLDTTVVGIELTLICIIQGLALARARDRSAVQPMRAAAVGNVAIRRHRPAGDPDLLVAFADPHAELHRVAARVRPHLRLLRRDADRSRRADAGRRSAGVVRAECVLRARGVGPVCVGPARRAADRRHDVRHRRRTRCCTKTSCATSAATSLLLMPMAVAFQGLSWWLVHRFRDAMLHGRWHLLLIGLTIALQPALPAWRRAPAAAPARLDPRAPGPGAPRRLNAPGPRRPPCMAGSRMKRVSLIMHPPTAGVFVPVPHSRSACPASFVVSQCKTRRPRRRPRRRTARPARREPAGEGAEDAAVARRRHALDGRHARHEQRHGRRGDAHVRRRRDAEPLRRRALRGHARHVTSTSRCSTSSIPAREAEDLIPAGMQLGKTLPLVPPKAVGSRRARRHVDAPAWPTATRRRASSSTGAAAPPCARGSRRKSSSR